MFSAQAPRLVQPMKKWIWIIKPSITFYSLTSSLAFKLHLKHGSESSNIFDLLIKCYKLYMILIHLLYPSRYPQNLHNHLRHHHNSPRKAAKNIKLESSNQKHNLKSYRYIDMCFWITTENIYIHSLLNYKNICKNK